jgi:hypothetical protein
VTYRVILAAGAAARFHHLPDHARDALVARAAELVDAPWDPASVLRPGDDPAFRETTFDQGQGLIDFYVDEAAEVIRIFNIVWLG